MSKDNTDMSLSELLMYSALKLEMLNEKEEVTGSGTGFIMKFLSEETDNKGVVVLVTNRHNLSNVPKFKTRFLASLPDGSPDHKNIYESTIDTDSTIFHPNPEIDLAIVPLQPTFDEFQNDGIIPFFVFFEPKIIPSNDEWKSLDAIESVTMVSYPKGLRDNVNNLPIFRQGTTATHPSFNFEGNPYFLVDLPCYPGCSGSPVFLFDQNRVLYDRNEKRTVVSNRFRLLGIQFGTPSLRTESDVVAVSSQSDTTQLKAISPLYINIGFVIKSTELHAFKIILADILGLTIKSS